MSTDKAGTTPKRWWPLVLAVGGFVLLLRSMHSPDVAPTMCERDVAPETVDVMMLSAAWCRYCARARAYFIDEGVNYCEFDIELTQKGARLYRDSGIQGIPIIMIEDEIIIGFDPGAIKAALKH